MRRWLAALLLVMFPVLAAPAPAGALGPVSEIRIESSVLPDGTVEMVERRTYKDARPVEFVEMVVPEPAEFELLSVRDAAGEYQQKVIVADRGYRLERSGQIVYIEWQSNPPANEIILTYRLRQILTIHQGAVEFYWPTVAGGGRSISKVGVELRTPSAQMAALYAYGGKQGGVLVPRRDPFRIVATDVPADRTFEWRLLIPRSRLGRRAA